MAAGNADAVRRSFAGQAAAFEDPSRHFASADVATWMRSNTPTKPTDVVLEVAAGTALFGRAIATSVAAVVAADLTREMLLAGRAGAEASGLPLSFETADVVTLPHPDASFDLVVSRLAVHHFPDPLPPLREMLRVCRPAGHVVVIDMVVVEDEAKPFFNELERRRDPAHANALTRQELLEAIIESGSSIEHTSTWDNVLVPDAWFAQTRTAPADVEAITAAWRAELAGGRATGMDPRVVGGRMEFVHHWDLVVARPARSSPG
jgi:ubiquinone/menaquinone biosynthesis C-methylase UbiE